MGGEEKKNIIEKRSFDIKSFELVARVKIGAHGEPNVTNRCHQPSTLPGITRFVGLT